MRDPNRINPILACLGDIWRQYPDLRLGQLIMNLEDFVSLYNIEDEDLIEKLQQFYHFERDI